MTLVNALVAVSNARQALLDELVLGGIGEAIASLEPLLAGHEELRTQVSAFLTHQEQQEATRAGETQPLQTRAHTHPRTHAPTHARKHARTHCTPAPTTPTITPTLPPTITPTLPPTLPHHPT